MKVQSVVTINLIFVRILLYLIVNLSLRLQVEFSLLEVDYLLTAQIRFTLCLNNNNHHLYLFSDKRLKNHKITK